MKPNFLDTTPGKTSGITGLH